MAVKLTRIEKPPEPKEEPHKPEADGPSEWTYRVGRQWTYGASIKPERRSGGADHDRS